MPTSPPLLTHTAGFSRRNGQLTNQQVSYQIFISSRGRSIQSIYDLDFLEDHLLIPFLHCRPSRRQFERTTTLDALIGLPTASFSINCKFLSLIDRMRSSNRPVLFPMNALFSLAPLLEQSQPRSAQTLQRTPHFHHFFRPSIKSLPNIIFEPTIINTDHYFPLDQKSSRRSFRSCPSTCFATTASLAATKPPRLPSTSIT